MDRKRLPPSANGGAPVRTSMDATQAAIVLGGRNNRIQFRPESFLPDITGPARDPNKNQRNPTALIAAGQGNVRKM